ncbi:MAG: hypothetical protein ACOYVF_11510 [Candidatus Zixiibacteriota bacterium]
MPEKYKCSRLRLAAGFAILAVLTAVLPLAGSDDVVEYYWSRAASVLHSRDLLESGVSYSFIAESIYKRINKRGEITSADSLKAEYFFSWGKLDSSKIIEGDGRRFKNLDLTFPNVFKSDYINCFYPNDTGGTELAIGFDTDSLNDPRPVGLVLIDRHRYVPLWMYLYYPQKKSYDRFSRSFRFTEYEGYVFADSVWEVGKKQGIFTSEHYRLETGVSDMKIYR